MCTEELNKNVYLTFEGGESCTCQLIPVPAIPHLVLISLLMFCPVYLSSEGSKMLKSLTTIVLLFYFLGSQQLL